MRPRAVGSRTERVALCVAGGLLCLKLGHSAITGAVRSAGSLSLPWKASVIATALAAGLGTGFVVKEAVQPVKHRVDRRSYCIGVGLVAGLPIWALAAKFLHGKIPVPHTATIRNFLVYNAKLSGALLAGVVPALIVAAATGFTMVNTAPSPLASYDTMGDLEPTNSGIATFAGLTLVTLIGATGFVKNWMNMPEYGGKTWLALIRGAGILGVGFLPGFAAGYPAGRGASLVYDAQIPKRELTAVERVGFGVGTLVTLWSLSRAFLPSQGAPSRLAYAALLPITAGGARLGDLLHGKRVEQLVKAENDRRKATLDKLDGALSPEQIREVFKAVGPENRATLLGALDGKGLLALQNELTDEDIRSVDSSLAGLFSAILELKKGLQPRRLSPTDRALLEADPVLRDKLLPAEREPTTA